MNNQSINKSIAESYSKRIWKERDLTAIDELFDPNIIIHSLLGDFKGSEAMKNVVKDWYGGFPNLTVNNEFIVHENDLVVIHWKAHGNHKGLFKGIKPSGKLISYKGVSIYRIQKEKIVEYWGYLDMDHVLTQIKTQ